VYHDVRGEIRVTAVGEEKVLGRSGGSDENEVDPQLCSFQYKMKRPNAPELGCNRARKWCLDIGCYHSQPHMRTSECGTRECQHAVRNDPSVKCVSRSKPKTGGTK
jgi:hypothetical protein